LNALNTGDRSIDQGAAIDANAQGFAGGHFRFHERQSDAALCASTSCGLAAAAGAAASPRAANASAIVATSHADDFIVRRL